MLKFSEKQNTVAGILGVVSGLGLLIAQDSIIKTLSEHYTIVQLMFIRSVFALVIFYCISPFVFDSYSLKSNRPGLQILRGTLQFLSFTCYYIALKTLPVLDLVTLFFSAPLIAVALSMPVLKEKISFRHWVAVGVGFFGAMIMIGPDGLDLNENASVLAVGAAILYAGSIVVTRILGESDEGTITARYTLIMYALLAGLAVGVLELLLPQFFPQTQIASVDYWRTPEMSHIGLLLLAGVTVCIAFLFLAHAYRQAPVSVLAPWEYSALIWGGLFGYLFWAELPSFETLLGAALIVSSGIYISKLPD